MDECIAAIDQGTTSTRCLLFNHAGSLLASHQLEHRQIYPQPGWVEHDPLEILQRTRDVFNAVAQRANSKSLKILGLGITNQRETTVIWNRKTGQPYYNAIVWQDTRTDEICNTLALEGGVDRFRPDVGLPLSTYFSAPKIKWILDNIPVVRADAEKGLVLFGNIDTWLIWNLTGGARGGSHVTDVTNASRTMLMNLQTLDWDRDILSTFGIPASILPEIVPSIDPTAYGFTQVFGDADPSLPIGGDMGDQQAALFGQAGVLPGNVKNTYGTGCFLLLNTGKEIVHSINGLLTTVAYQARRQPAIYALEGSVAITGALVQWLRDNLGLIQNASEIEPLARSVEDNGGIYFVPAFSGLFAPHWRSDARGIIIGLTRFINKGHLGRAVLEATAFQTREILEAMQKDAGFSIQELRVDGGMVHNDLLMQFQADILGLPIIRSTVAETTALGAAYAAGLAFGFWKDLNDLKQNWVSDKSWQPSMSAVRKEDLFAHWNKAVARTFDWI